MSKEQAIVEAAAKRFRHYGIGKTTMQEIAQDAGMAVGTLYLYFANKDALVVACAEKFAERHRREAAEVLASKVPADMKLRRYILARFRQTEETRTASPHAAEITRAVLRVKPNRIQEDGMMIWEVVVKILAEGNAAGLFRVADPRRDAKVFLYSLAAFFPNALSPPPVEPKEVDLMQVIDWFLDVWKTGSRTKSTSGPRRRTARLRGK